MRCFAFVFALTCCATVGTVAPARFSADYTHPNTVDLGAIQAEELAKAEAGLRELAVSGAKNVTLRIDSPGGGIFAGFEFIRSMEDLKKAHGMRITCVVDGVAMSMAAVLLESPLCDVRLATTRSLLLFHNGSTGTRGTSEDLRQAGVLLDAINRAMSLTVARRISMDVEAYRAKLALGDWAMGVEEALAANAIDGLVEPQEIAPPGGSA